jgi:hypothetical protein
MTSATDRRIKQVEEALYPTEAMALWLREAKAEHRSLGDLVQSLRNQPEEAWPLFRLTAQAEAAAKDRLRGRASTFGGRPKRLASFLDQGERDAVRDAATLWYLFVEVNERFMAERRALWLSMALHHASMALLFSVHRDWLRAGGTDEESPDERLRTTLAELYMWDGAARTLAERYYHEQRPLLGEAQDNLDELIEHGVGLAERFNEHLEMEIEARRASGTRGPKLPARIDLVAVRRAALPSVDAHVRLLVDVARAEACEMIGEWQKALAFAAQHLY